MDYKAKGIDVSYSNGVIDWQAVKNGGQVDFAIIRCGYGKINCAKQTDTQFGANYAGAKAVGIPVGAYHYSYALTVADALQEADFCLSLLKGKQFEYPIFFDVEEKTQIALSKELLTAITVAFCSKVEAAGYWVGVYSYSSALQSEIDYNKFGRFDCWVAHTGVDKPAYPHPYGMWQYAHDGNVPGANISNGKCDMNYAYKDYPTLIKNADLNGFAKIVQAAVPEPRYSVTFTDISSKDECENLAVEVGAKGYLNHRIEVQK